MCSEKIPEISPPPPALITSLFDELLFDESLFNESLFNEPLFNEPLFNESLFSESLFNESLFNESLFNDDGDSACILLLYPGGTQTSTVNVVNVLFFSLK